MHQFIKFILVHYNYQSLVIVCVLILDRWILSLMKPNRLDLRQYKNFSLFLQNYEMFVCLKIESFLLSHSYKFTNYMG